MKGIAKRNLAIVLVACVLVAGLVVGIYTSRPLDQNMLNRFQTPSLPSGLPQRQVAAPEGQVQSDQIADLTGRLVVNTGSLSLEVANVRDMLHKIEVMAGRMGGYVASSSASSAGGHMTGMITIRVPRDQFQAALDEIGQLGRVKDLRTSSEDVTLQFIDLKARLNNLEREESRLAEILSTARTTDEVLKVEKELQRVRGEIERLTGQINYIQRNVQLSAVTAYLSEPDIRPLPSLDWSGIWVAALTALYYVVKGLVVIGVAIVPLAAVGIPLYVAVRHLMRR